MSEELSKNVTEIKEILSVTDNKLDKYLEFCERLLVNKILDICNLEKLPEKLNTTVQEFLIEQYKLNEKGVLEGKKEVTSASDNGQTVNFKTVGGIEKVSQNVDEFLDRNMSTLVQYRKLPR